MEHIRLGASGLKVSRICLGIMTFGAGADEATSFAIMDRFLERGGTFPTGLVDFVSADLRAQFGGLA